MTGTYIVAAIHDWNRKAFEENKPTLPGTWHFVSDRSALTLERVQEIKPDYIFFPHWSWKVPPEILNAAECVCFHMTDVPYGRGGSPLQNLIARGHKDTKLTALRMVEDMDAGPVYMKKDLSLEGRAEEIYARAGRLSYDMMRQIIADKMVPVDQTGEPTVFPRRTPDMGEIKPDMDISALFDHIRMLDAPGYPHAFLNFGSYTLTFTHAKKADGNEALEAKVTIKRTQDKP